MVEFISILASLFKPDERFIMHRYYSSRFSLIVGLTLMVIWFNYELIVNQQLRLDFAIIIGAMALAKILAMLYYRTLQ
ncbi:MAG: hypothetical protein GTO14_06280 [Anaerolineales bacterium]|nr:hypothetical protein [Anaerolineales bacterium]